MDQNNITGDRLVSKAASKEYRENFDNIFKMQPKSTTSAEESPELHISFTPDFALREEDNDVGC